MSDTRTMPVRVDTDTYWELAQRAAKLRLKPAQYLANLVEADIKADSTPKDTGVLSAANPSKKSDTASV